MSVTKNHVLSTWKVVEDHLRCPSYFNHGIALSPENNIIWADAISLCAMAWMDLSSSSHVPTPRWLIPWLRKIASTDVSEVVAAFKLADSEIVNTVSSFSNYDTFKQCLKASHVEMGLIAPLKWLIDAWYLYRNPATFRLVHTALTFVTRVNLPGLDGLVENAVVSYLSNEDRLKTLDGFSDEESHIISTWYPYQNVQRLYDNWTPKHGPGAVADLKGKVPLNKYLAGATDAMINRLDLLLGGQSQYTFSNRLERESKLVLVPKSIDKLRTISMEPSTLQWYQQGFMQSILIEMKNTPLKRRIELKDQELSRQLCYEGSIDGKLSTIDLSDASDSVSMGLIRQWFRSSSLLPICVMTRSRAVKMPIGDKLVVEKFAPMGSALCFPIECILFAAMAEASIHEAGGSTHSSQYRVYGDDIIIETKYAPTLIRRLQKNGFKVNSTKSFYHKDTHNYRESCGAEFLDGVDVSPIRLPRNFAGVVRGSSISSSSIEVSIALCNSCFSMLPSVRRVLIKQCMTLPKELRPVFDYNGERGIFSPNPTNFHLPVPKYRKRYQNFWISHGAAMTPRKNKGVHGDESVAYYDTLNEIGKRGKDLLPEDPYYSSMTRKPSTYWGVTSSNMETLVNPQEQRDKKEEGIK